MSPLQDVLTRVLKDLAGIEARHALIGGIAISARTEPRFTRDIDLAVAVESDEHAERTVRALIGLGYRMQAVVEQTATKRLATARLVSPYHPDLFVDLLFASCGAEAEIVGRAEPLELAEGLTAMVATAGDLMATKVLSRDEKARPQDTIDLVNLLKGATPDDIAQARETLALMEARGFHRGKKLVRTFDRLRRKYGSRPR